MLDAHAHIWDLERRDYSWITQDLSPLRRTYTAAELGAELEAADVDEVILVQGANDRDDTEYLLAIAGDSKFVAGVIGWFPLDQPREVERLVSATPLGLIGARHILHHEHDRRWIAHPSVVESLQLLGAARLAFDISAIWPDHFEAVEGMLSHCESTCFVLNHLGAPPLAPQGHPQWLRDLRRISKHQNVFCKASALLHHSRQRQEVLALVESAFSVFGSARMIFGSDWPVLRLHGSYRTWFEIATHFASTLNLTERADFLGGNAHRAYRLDASSTA